MYHHNLSIDEKNVNLTRIFDSIQDTIIMPWTVSPSVRPSVRVILCIIYSAKHKTQYREIFGK